MFVSAASGRIRSPLSRVTTVDLVGFVAAMRARFSPCSMKAVRTALRSFLRYYCRVFAPMQGQVTVRYLEPTAGVSPTSLVLAYQDSRRFGPSASLQARPWLRAHWPLARVVPGGQADEEADRPQPCAPLPSGGGDHPRGNVLVKRGSAVGGDVKHIPARPTPGQPHCVIASPPWIRPLHLLASSAVTDPVWQGGAVHEPGAADRTSRAP